MNLDVSTLRRAMALPAFDGRAAQRAMEPARRAPRPTGRDVEAPRVGAALAYVFEREGELHLPLTLRRADLPEHSGQVSLPGGRPEPGERHWAAALREANEEIGLRTEGLERLGVLAPVYIPVTHTSLLVHVALGPEPAAWLACPREVERIVVSRLDELVDPTRRRVRTLTLRGSEVEVPYFDVDGLFLWGATAMALSELVARLRSA